MNVASLNFWHVFGRHSERGGTGDVQLVDYERSRFDNPGGTFVEDLPTLILTKIMSEAATLFKVFSGTKSRDLAEKICNSLSWPLGRMNIEHFSDGEFAVSYEESIRGQYIYPPVPSMRLTVDLIEY